MPNPVVHWQLLSKDPEAHAAFYEDLFGWSLDADNALGYRRLDPGTEGGIDGGVWPAPPEAPNFVQLHVRVEDVDAYVTKAEGLGARVVMPAQSLPDGARMAVLCDPHDVPFVVTS